MIQFQREILSPALMLELEPHLKNHVKEAGYLDLHVPYLKPDHDRYYFIERNGNYRAFTARDEGELIGYMGVFVERNLHCTDIVTASMDLIYILPERRGCVVRFLTWCDNQLGMENVSTVYHHVPNVRDFSRVLGHLGYFPVEQIYARKL